MFTKSRIFAAVAAAAIVLSAGAASAQNWQLPAAYGHIQLAAGFTPDPHEINMTAGGPLRASDTLGNACPGFVADAPDYDLVWQAGNTTRPLVISVDSQTDTTLVVRTPSGQWLCEDDGGFNGMNPGMRIDNPQSGLYDIWVGTYAGGFAPAVLSISELTSH
ncbi:MAG: peptidase S1 [Alphaproteobacteria bacterium]|nr:peptidase S1 [Alphaproteobacteria bacterium]